MGGGGESIVCQVIFSDFCVVESWAGVKILW